MRERSVDRLVSALVAVVLGGLAGNTPESLMRMAVIEDAARRVVGDCRAVFAQAADIVGEPGGAGLRSWLARSPEDRTLECMGFSAGCDESGFRYLWG
ncbi:MAG: hypothetical protein GXX79_11160 [Actinomycetales bacterium]|nr:hypothetical protein [Actinomycetales bacterium]